MELNFSRDEERFREEAREWLVANVPRDQQPEDGLPKREFDLAWQRRQYEGGWAGIAWPAEYGGRGLSLIQQLIWYEEYARAEAPLIGSCFIGVNHGGPTIILRGNAEQKSFHLPKILKGEVIWCQGFSEPGSGSDLASLRTAGRIEGDHLVVTGQKIWTSYAQLADYQELLVRTDNSGPKHKGITWIICDMKLPGITIRPIRTMSEVFHFCEVFYDEVRIPLANVVGEVNDGWSVAMSTLSFERGTAFMAQQMELAQAVERLIEIARTTPGPDGKRPAMADNGLARELAVLRSEVMALKAMAYATVSRALKRGTPGPEGSLMRLYYGELSQRAYRLAMEIRGIESLSFNPLIDGWTRRYLHSFKETISAGTAQIQRNIIGERLLGLPRESRVS